MIWLKLASVSTCDLDVSLPYIPSDAPFPSTTHVHQGLSSSQTMQSSLYVPFSLSIMFFSFMQFNFGGAYQPKDLQLEDSSLTIITCKILRCNCTQCSYINTTTNVCSLNNHVIQWQWHALYRWKSVPSCNTWLLISAGCQCSFASENIYTKQCFISLCSLFPSSSSFWAMELFQCLFHSSVLWSILLSTLSCTGTSH